jgi:uncharacterized membrane protein
MTSVTVEQQTAKRLPRTYQIARISVLTALAIVGSFIHLPSPIPTVAFDSWPGFFAALYFGPFDGAIVSGLGHVATSAVNGFPLGALHIPIALGLACAGWIIGAVNRHNRSWLSVIALAAGVAVNTGLVVILIPVNGLMAAIGFIPFLLLASCLNATVAGLTYFALKGRLPY